MKRLNSDQHELTSIGDTTKLAKQAAVPPTTNGWADASTEWKNPFSEAARK
jgi:hypothetical protein